MLSCMEKVVTARQSFALFILNVSSEVIVGSICGLDGLAGTSVILSFIDKVTINI